MNEETEDWKEINDVVYNLRVVVALVIETDAHKITIAKTLLKLPLDVKERVLDEVVFIFSPIAGYVSSLSFPILIPKTEIQKVVGDYHPVRVDQPVILLNFSEMRDLSNQKDIIAHEIAHFILNHYKMENQGSPSNEKDADDLSESWGFNRVHENNTQFQKRTG